MFANDINFISFIDLRQVSPGLKSLLEVIPLLNILTPSLWINIAAAAVEVNIASEPHASSSITSSGMFLSKRNLFSPFKAAALKGENKFLFDKNMPDEVIDELAWGSEAILTSTAAAAILIHNDGVNILRRGITSSNDFKPGETCLRSIKDMKLISLANTKFYPGRDEFFNFCAEIPSILVVPINNKAFILIGGWSTKCFTKSDEKWIKNWSKKINNIFSKNKI